MTHKVSRRPHGIFRGALTFLGFVLLYILVYMEVALYRKYRPQKFKDVLGQEHITDVVSSAIKLGNISHAYLFSGTRGTGKTSVARILASEIGTSSNDLYEMDAASNRGIDDIRELREAVTTLPFDSDYKVYIIDEAHMLTKDAFNALLKTLEEPPSHVIFILATTELHKIPDTIVSRCETYVFKKPGQEILKRLVLNISKKEGFEIEPSGAELLAILGDGSFRDTIGNLQKIIGSSSDKKISLNEIQKITGAPKVESINKVIASIADSAIGDALEVIREIVEKNVDIKIFLKLLLHKMRLLLLIRYAKDMHDDIKEELGEDDFVFINKLSQNPKINSKVLYKLLEAYKETANSHIQQLPLELSLIDIMGETRD